MPIEIRELHIRVAVSPEAKPQGAAARQTPTEDGADEKDAIVAECVEQVVQIIQAQKER
jgi:Family of unknown function (DUF5908)